MTEYRRKPVVIEAMQVRYYFDDATFEYDYGNTAKVADWVNLAAPASDARTEIEPSRELSFLLDTSGGPVHVASGDYIVRGHDGQFTPCKRAVFEAAHEPLPTRQEKP